MTTNTSYYEAPNPHEEVQTNETTTSTQLVAPQTMNYSLENITPRNVSGRTPRLLTRRAENEATYERYRAQLSQVAMTNTAALSALETQITAVVPNAAPRCKTIVDMYALSASARISRW